MICWICYVLARRFAHDRLMIDMARSTNRVTLCPFGRDDFSRLISWFPTKADLIEWCAAFFQYPLTNAQLERYLESTMQPNSRIIFTARSVDARAVGHIEISQIWPHLSNRLSRISCRTEPASPRIRIKHVRTILRIAAKWAAHVACGPKADIRRSANRYLENKKRQFYRGIELYIRKIGIMIVL